MNKYYAGIDYGNGKSNIDIEKGIRIGVISCNSFSPEAQNDFDPDYGRPEILECPECEHRFYPHVSGKEPLEWGCDVVCPECGEEFTAELPYCIESNGWTYENNGYALSSCLQNDCMVVRSPFYTYAQFCSPCVPGAGNLDNPFPFSQEIDADWKKMKSAAVLYRKRAEKFGFPKTYCLGFDFFDEFSHCPYPFIFSVETNEFVKPS